MNNIQFTQAQNTTVELLNHIDAKYSSTTLSNLFKSSICTMFNASNFEKLLGSPEKYAATSIANMTKEDQGQYYVNMAKKLALITDFKHQVIYKFITRYCAAIQHGEAYTNGKSVIDSTAIAVDMLQTPDAWEIGSIEPGKDGMTVEYINLQSKGLDILDNTDENELSINITMSNSQYESKFGTFESLFKNSLISTNDLESMHAIHA